MRLEKPDWFSILSATMAYAWIPQFVCQQLFRGFRLPGNAALSSLFYSLSRVGSGLWLRCVGCYLWMFPGCFRSIFSTPSWNVLCSIPLPNWFSFNIGRALQCPLRWSCSIPTCLPREFLQSMILFAYIDVDWKKSFTLHLIKADFFHDIRMNSIERNLTWNRLSREKRISDYMLYSVKPVRLSAIRT